jgi:hypothetical protein
MEPRPRLLAAGLAVLLLAFQAGCSGSGSAEPSMSAAVEVDGAELIDAFLDLVTSDGFTANTEMSGVLSAGALQLAIEATGSLVGPDGTMTLKLNTASDSLEGEVIFVGAYAYARLPRGEWQRVPRAEVNTSGAQLDPFEFLTSADDLRYDGTTTHGGVEVQVLAGTGPLALDPEQGASGEVTRLRILVLADGTPVFLSYHMTVSINSPGGDKVAARGDIEQSFSDVGEAIVIEPPATFVE